MLKVVNVTGGYTNGCHVLYEIDLIIKPGEIVGIIGLNGCGKSTLGKAIMNMLPYRKGEIHLNDDNISNLLTYDITKRGISMVLQGGRIFKNMTVEEHFQLVANSSNISSKSIIKKRLDELQGLLGIKITTHFSSKASYLSGGEKQQLALVLALMDFPKYLILDEVSSGLSKENLINFSNVIQNLRLKTGIGIILIEQNIELARSLSDRLISLERGRIHKEYKISSNII